MRLRDAVVWGPFDVEKRVEMSSAWYDPKTSILTGQTIKKDSEVCGSLRLTIRFAFFFCLFLGF